MVVGHSAGVAAALAVEARTAVQDVSITKLQAVLRAQGQVLTLAERKPVPGGPPPPPHPHPSGSDTPLSVGACTEDTAVMTTVNKTSTTTTVALLLLNAKGECASVIGYSSHDGAVLVSASCHTGDKSPGHQNQEFVVDSSNHRICLASSATAVAAASASVGGRCTKGGCVVRVGTTVVLGGCGGNSSSSGWDVDATAKRIRVVGGSCVSSCLVARG